MSDIMENFSNNTGLMAFTTIWSLLGVAAFITSLICFGFRSSGLDQKVLAFLVAIILGPFYWLYFYYAKDYCKRK